MRSLLAGIAFGLGVLVTLVGLKPEGLRAMAKGIDRAAEYLEDTEHESDVRLGSAIAHGIQHPEGCSCP